MLQPQGGPCQLRARSIGHRPVLTGNHGARSGPAQVNGRPGEGTKMRLSFQTGYAGSIPVARSTHEGPGQPALGDLGL
jgi:hypothetical protein